MVRTRLIWLGEPAVVMPARRQVLLGVSFSVVRTRLGSARSSKKMSRISSWVIVNSKSSSLSPLSEASLPRPAPSPARGFLISSPVENSLLPGSTKSRSPALFGSRRKRGSFVPLVEVLILRSLARSATLESLSDFCTASRIWLRARLRKRWRLPSDLPFGFRRRSTKWVIPQSLSSRARRPQAGARPGPIEPLRRGSRHALASLAGRDDSSYCHPALLTRMYHSTSRRTWRGV